eukprot:CAMPEP_0197323126 /NCGR_PEP_ID=MMETSP0891-20130614/70323_1 /TAXON_ID=44058 ORGANISM="Aureoumbra lagunensis, Strain CCMP1510" /NCGR_SAMPLE_ID=MMETSP0891 /ASSEMBLY_ACC=CAM_ASM_000534 /LENGTH=699 /DNA_ID=CAMNT_0042815691 /DNA_START=85 /DNA_END=2185 /DNA_ORIENTATION=-
MALIITNDFGNFDVQKFTEKEQAFKYWRHRPCLLARVLFVREDQRYCVQRQFGTRRAILQIKTYLDNYVQEERKKDPRQGWLFRTHKTKPINTVIEKSPQLDTQRVLAFVQGRTIQADERDEQKIGSGEEQHPERRVLVVEMPQLDTQRVLAFVRKDYEKYECRRFTTTKEALDWGKKSYDVGACYLEEDDEDVLLQLQPHSAWGEPQLLAQLKRQVEANGYAKRMLRTNPSIIDQISHNGNMLTFASGLTLQVYQADTYHVAKSLTSLTKGLDNMSVLAAVMDDASQPRQSQEGRLLRTLASTYNDDDDDDDAVTEEIETQSPLHMDTNDKNALEDEEYPLVLCTNIKSVDRIPASWPKRQRFCAATLVTSSLNKIGVCYRSKSEYCGNNLDFDDGFAAAFIIPPHQKQFKLMVSLHDDTSEETNNYLSSMEAYAAVSATRLGFLREKQVLNLSDQDGFYTGAGITLSAVLINLSQAKECLLNVKTDCIVMLQQRQQLSCWTKCFMFNCGTNNAATAWQDAGIYKPQDPTRPFLISAPVPLQEDVTFETLCPLRADAQILKPWHTRSTRHTDAQGWQYGYRLDDNDWYAEPLSSHAFRRASWYRLSFQANDQDNENNSGPDKSRLLKLESASERLVSSSIEVVKDKSSINEVIDIQTLVETYGYPLSDESRRTLELACGDATSAVGRILFPSQKSSSL